MKQELESKLLVILDELHQGVKEGVRFSLEHAPITLQQIVEFNIYYNTLMFWISIICLIASIAWWFWAYESYEKVLPTAAALFFLFVTIFSELQLYKLKNTPELFLYEYVKKEIKGT